MPALDTRLDWEAIEAVANGQVATGQDPSAGAVPTVPPDPLADLLQIPIRKLTAPLAVASTVLGDTIYLVSTDAQAATVRATGGTPYTPEEIDLLWELYQAVKPEVWGERLKLIHEAKRRFDGTIQAPEEENRT